MNHAQEARRVYDAEDRAREACPRPLATAQDVTALVRIVEKQAAFQGNHVKVTHRGKNSRGGARYTHGKKPTKLDLLSELRLGKITWIEARRAWDARVQEYFSQPLQTEYFVKIAPCMRDAYTVTHEMAHVLQVISVPGCSGRLGHGLDFRTLHIQVAECLDPKMAQALRTEYLAAGLD